MLAFPYWCSETFSIDGKISSWSPVTQTDHKLLEEAIKTQEKLIYIETKRTCADLTKRSLRGCYDFNFSSSATSPPFTDCDRRIIRATWFYLDSSSTVPLSEEVGDQIEKWFNTIKNGQPTAEAPFTAEMDVEVVLNNERGGKSVTYRVYATKEVSKEQQESQRKRLEPAEDASASSKLKINGFTIKMYPKASSLLKLGSLVLQRGLVPPPATPEEAWARLPEQDHLCLVVHGIGQYYFAGTDDSFSSCIHKMRRNLMEQRCALDVEDAAYAKSKVTGAAAVAGGGDTVDKEKKEKEVDENPNNHKRIECLGVEWFNEVHDDEAVGMHAALDKVTLPSVLSVRKLAHNVAMDVMLYLTPEFRRKILRLVVEKINLTYQQFSALNPSFVKNGGMCSLVGHSLGTVIVYDVLAMQSDPDLPAHLKLVFDPTAYFSLGSPLGMFLTIRNSAAKVHNFEIAAAGSGGKAPLDPLPQDDDVLNATYSFPTCKQFFNVFNKNDPVAYRVEPLLDESLLSREPVIVPHYDGGLRAQYMLKSVATSISQTWKSLASPSGWFKSATSTLSSTSTSTISGTSTGSGSGQSAHPILIDVKKTTSSSGGDSELRVLQKEAASLRRQKIFPPMDLVPHIQLNGGRRVDFQLQESVVEAANEFLSSLTSHTSYFEQKDVARFIAAMLI